MNSWYGIVLPSPRTHLSTSQYPSQLTTSKGHNNLLRRLPNLLRLPPPALPLRHLLDRLHHRVPPLLRRNRQRPPHRRRVLLPRDAFRRLSHRIRDLHGISVYHLLAISSCARNLYRARKRLYAHSNYDDYLYVFPEKAPDCDGDCCVRECNWRIDIPEYGEDVVAYCWVWVDVKSNRVYPVRDISSRSRSSSTEISAQSDAGSRGLERLPDA
jgi:hypothetical protein